jgi:hypothetical protein
VRPSANWITRLPGGQRAPAPGHGRPRWDTQQPAPALRGNADVPRGNAAALRGKRSGTHKETRGARGAGNATAAGRKSMAPGRELAAAMRETRGARRAQMRQAIARQTVTPQVSGPPSGNMRQVGNPLLITRRAACPASTRRVDPSSPGGETIRGRAEEPQDFQLAGAVDRPGSLFPDHKFRDRKCLLAASETTIIHSLTGQLPERDQLLPLNGRHIGSRPQPWPPRPPGGTASAAGNRLLTFPQVRRLETRGAPGRGRTDTGDPFRGPASSFGLRGLGNDTSAEPDYSRPAYRVEKDLLRCIYSIIRS